MKQFTQPHNMTIDYKVVENPIKLRHGQVNDLRFNDKASQLALELYTKVYRLWQGIFDRVNTKKTYADVEICKEWYVFSNFAEWAYTHDIHDIIYNNLQLDKDTLSGESKIYSPETCQFISAQENLALRDMTNSGGPIQVIAINPHNLKDCTIYKSAMEAERVMGASKGNIVKCCQGAGLRTTKGYKWFYLTSDGLIKAPVHFYKFGTPASQRNQEYVYLQVWELTGEREEFFTRMMF